MADVNRDFESAQLAQATEFKCRNNYYRVVAASLQAFKQ